MINHAHLQYDPMYRDRKYDYYYIGQLLRTLLERCDRPNVQKLCEEALSYQPSGLQLRNDYLLEIRAGLEEWKEGTTLHIIIKNILERVLHDTVAGGKYPYDRLSLNTLVAFDYDASMDMTIART